MDINKRGIFYTAGFFLLGSLVLSLVILSFKNFNYSQQRTGEVLIFDRIYTIDSSIKDGFREIFEEKSGIEINKGASIRFIEPLPNKYEDDFVTAVNKYKQFLESNFSVMLNTENLNSKMPLKIIPHEIEYYHENFGDSVIKINANSSNFNGYNISIDTDETLSSTSCAKSGSAQNVYLNVFATGRTGSCSAEDLQISIVEVSNTNNVKIVTISVSGNDLTITGSLPINVTTSVDSLDELETAYVTFPKELLYLNFSEFGIVKNSTVILV